MSIQLVEILGLCEEDQSEWQIRALKLDERSPTLAILEEWKKKQPNDFNRIIKVMKIVGTTRGPTINQNHVKTSQNPNHHGIYEMIAKTGHARLMFFYSKSESVVICTNGYWKEDNKNKQNRAFKSCNESASMNVFQTREEY